MAPRILPVLVVLVCGCGARTTPLEADLGDAIVDPPRDSESVLDTALEDTAITIDVASGACPARHPLPGQPCDDEGRSCVFGSDCRSECVCERGSWVCAADTCASSCPEKVPARQPCTASEVDRVCSYPRGCPVTCRCDVISSGAFWNCVSPPC